MNNIVKLDIDRKLISLAGREYAKNFVDEQVLSKLSESTMNTIVFPEYIEFITGSFLDTLIHEVNMRTREMDNIGLHFENERLSTKFDMPNIKEYIYW